MPLNTEHAVQEHLDRLSDADTKDRLTFDASVTEGRDVSVEVSVNRSWRNGWGLAAYGKAWWKGADVKVQGEAGVSVTKDF